MAKTIDELFEKMIKDAVLEKFMEKVDAKLNAITDQIMERLDSYGTINSEWITVRQVANYINRSESNIYSRISQGTFPVKERRIGGSVLFKKSELDAYLNSQ